MKNRTGLLLVFLVLSNLSFSQNLNDSLIVAYRLNGNVIDISGNELHGTLYGAIPITDRFGNENSALFFDGIDDYIDLPNNNLLKPPIPVSFSFWVKVEVISQNKCIFFDTDFQDNNYSGCFMSARDNADIVLHFGSNWGGAGYQYRRSKFSEETISAQTWHHIVGVIRGATDMTIYIDGQDAGGEYGGLGYEFIGYTTANGKLACDHPQEASPYNKYLWGSLDDFGMWSRALTQADVDELYNISVGSDEKITIKYVYAYPNPCKDYLIIRATEKINLAGKFEIFDMQGQSLMIDNINGETEMQIDTKSLSDGIYYLKYQDMKGVVSNIKFVKK